MKPRFAQQGPLAWVPTLYLAQGLPYYTVALVAALMFKSLGQSNEQIARWTGLLGLAWVIKPLWSPLIELMASKRKVVLVFETLAGLSLGLVAMALQLPHYFVAVLLVLALASLAAASHDIAADGLYITHLNAAQQARYSGWCGAFFNASKFIALGGLVILAGWLESRMAVRSAWSLIFVIVGLLQMALALYHCWALPPTPAKERQEGMGLATSLHRLGQVLTDFFRKPGIWLALAFIILFRAGEAQVQTIGPLFLRDARAAGGLGLSTADVGTVYGTLGSAAFILGSIAGGYFSAWLGLKRALFWLILAMNVPNLAFYFLGLTQPTALPIISTALGLEMFGYGFGFVGLILYMMQVLAVGRYQTAHYAFASGVMQLGFVLFKMISGDLQLLLGYQRFFLLALLSALPALLLSRFLRLPEAAGK